MPFDKFKSIEGVWEERRKRVRDSLQTISLDELKDIVKQHEEEFVGVPWRDKFLRLMAERPQASFYRAAPQEDVVVYYCGDADFGIWVVPGSGAGPLDRTGKRIMKEAIEGPVNSAKVGVKK